MRRSPAAFFAELKRRRVFKAALFYAVAAWLAVQVAGTVMPLLQLPAWTATLVLVLAILGAPFMLVFAWIYDVTPGGVVETPAAVPSPVPTQPAAAPRSVAVLPFVDMSPQQDQEHFSDGIAEEILNVLTRMPHLRVAARTSAFAFKGRNEDVRRIGEHLAVGTVLEGSVRVMGNRIRITAQLIDVTSGYHLWSERYDREMGDVFAIQDEIAESIARALDVQIGGSCPHTQVVTDNIEAYEYYLRGQQLLRDLRRPHVEQAREMFLQAVALDPSYAMAYARAAETSCLLHLYWSATPENLNAAQMYAERAIALAPEQTEAHVARGQVLSLQNKYDEAAREFEIALRGCSLSFDAHYYYARAGWAAGDFETAEAHFRKAAQVRPEDFQSLSLLGSVLLRQGRTEEARATARAAHDRVLKHLTLYPDDARALYLAAGQLAVMGDKAGALEFGDRASRIDPTDAAIAYNVACLYANLGEVDLAIARLRDAIDHGFAHREWILNDGDWAAVRDDARFRAAVDSIPA